MGRGSEGPGPTARVSEWMTAEVATLDMNDSLAIADDVMRLGRVRHMPVVDDSGALVGIVSQRDLFRGALARALGYGSHAQDRVLGMLLVKEVMTSDVRTVAPDATLEEAGRRMLEHKIGALVVTDAEGRLVGILTESDFVRAVIEAAPAAG
ncbi:MAG: CBS domain-containing protein [Myxococcota bacterium]